MKWLFSVIAVHLLSLTRGYKFESYKGLYSTGYNLKTVIYIITFLLFLY